MQMVTTKMEDVRLKYCGFIPRLEWPLNIKYIFLIETKLWQVGIYRNSINCGAPQGSPCL